VIQLERIEAAGYASFFERGEHAATARTGGAVCIAYPPLASLTMINRATLVEEEVDVDAIEAFFSDQRVRFAIGVPPGREPLERELERRGYERGYAWMKFARPIGDPPADVPTDLRVEEAAPADAEAFALVECEAYGVPPETTSLWTAALEAPGTHVFIAWAGDEPAAAGLVHFDGGYAWVGAGGTRPDFRRRGGQGAVLAARLRLAGELGAHTVATETGEQIPDRPSNSYRNILRHGFQEQYLRPNWIAPA
jgi:hypothetical protein